MDDNAPELSRSERARNAVRSLHSAVLSGGTVSDVTKGVTARYIAGEISSAEVQRRIRGRYNL